MTVPAKSLVGRTLVGFGWIFAWRMATRLLGMGSTVVLVRLLVPADFGLLALSSSFLQAIDAMSALGVEDAVVRAHAHDRPVFDTAFTMIALRSATMALVMALGAWPLAQSFGEPRLAPVMLVTAALTLLGGFENVRVLEFRRDIRFEREFMLQLVPRLMGVATAITVAVIWRNYWALVAGSAMQRLLRLGMSYIMRPYRPQFTLVAWRGLAGFSMWTWMISMARLARDRIHVFIIGWLLGAGPLGLFVVAQDLGQMPGTELILPMGRAVYSAFALARRGDGDGEAIWLRMIGLISIMVFPAGVGLALVAEPLVRLMLGPQWAAAVPLLQFISIACALTLFDEISHMQFDACGLLRTDFAALCGTMVVRVTAAVVLVPLFGLWGAAASLLLAVAIEQLVYLAVKRRVLPFKFTLLLAQIWRPALATAGMAWAVAASGLARLPASVDAASLVWHLCAPAVLGAVVYASLVLLMWVIAGKPQAGPEAGMLATLTATLRRWRRR